MAKIKFYITRFITLVVALQLLNMSLYTEDFKPLPANRETTTEVNVTESVTEFVVEVVLGHKNAIPEVSNEHQHSLLFHKHISFKALNEMNGPALPLLTRDASALNVPLNEPYSSPFPREINPPPPKA